MAERFQAKTPMRWSRCLVIRWPKPVSVPSLYGVDLGSTPSKRGVKRSLTHASPGESQAPENGWKTAWLSADLGQNQRAYRACNWMILWRLSIKSFARFPHCWRNRAGSSMVVELTWTLPSFSEELKEKLLIYQSFYFAKTAKNAIFGSLLLRSAHNSDKRRLNAWLFCKTLIINNNVFPWLNIA